MFGFEFGEGEGFSEVAGGGFEVAELGFEFGEDGVEEVVVLELGVVLDACEAGDACGGALHAGEGDGAVEGDDGGVVELDKVVVEREDAGPVGGGVVGGGAVAGGDAGLEVVLAELGALGGAGEVLEAGVDHGAVPLGAVLILEAEDAAFFIHTGREAGAGEQHDGGEGVDARDIAGGMPGEQGGELDGLAAEFVADEGFAAGRLVALIEEEVEREEHGIEARGEVVAGGDGEGDALLLDLLACAGDALGHGGLAGEKGGGDFGGAESAQGFQSEGDLGILREHGVAAGEHEAQAVIGKLGLECGIGGGGGFA